MIIIDSSLLQGMLSLFGVLGIYIPISLGYFFIVKKIYHYIKIRRQLQEIQHFFRYHLNQNLSHTVSTSTVSITPLSAEQQKTLELVDMLIED